LVKIFKTQTSMKDVEQLENFRQKYLETLSKMKCNFYGQILSKIFFKNRILLNMDLFILIRIQVLTFQSPVLRKE
jgi:hypothetical protein